MFGSMAQSLDFRHGGHGHREAAPGQRRVGEDKQLDRRALALFRRRGRPRAEGGRRRDTEGDRRRGGGDARSAARAQAGRDPRQGRRLPRPPTRGGRADDLRGSRQAAEDRARRGVAGDVVPMDASQAGEGKLAFTLRVPIGVVGAISPFNFPLNLVAHKIAPALAAGCAVVLKPASQTPLSALLLAELEHDAGLPPGWLNVLVGPSGEIGDVLVEDERVALITFTGSGAVGWGIRERAPRKRVNLELGNATPVIVEADADVDDAASRCAANAFSFAGQSCISVQRIFVHENVYDAFRDAFVPRVEALVVGDPSEEETDVGPLISARERDRVLDWIDEARRRGASILTGGTLEGELVRPTVVERPPADTHLACDEAFGPVCTIEPYATLDEAIALANGTRYGLQAGIFTADVKRALHATRSLEFGGVTVNEAPTFRADQMPYGGVKDSGNTREGPSFAVREMTEERLVVIQL